MMTVENDLIYEKAFILGNGFDVALGLPTRYSEFVKSPRFEGLLLNGNNLALFIKDASNIKDWLDVEVEIGLYSKKIEDEYTSQRDFKAQTILFENEFYQLRDALFYYIDDIRGRKSTAMDEECKAWIKSLIQFKDGSFDIKKALFITFNYSVWDNTILLFDTAKSNDYFVGGSPHSIHGCTQSTQHPIPNIVLGVDEESIYCKKHLFIVKRYNKNNKSEVFFKNIRKAKEITIFGCSMGITDRCYFKFLFKNAKDKIFNIYCYGEKDRMSIMNNISEFCDYGELIANNEINYFNSKEYNSVDKCFHKFV